jgi:hypothetical protein
MNSRKVVKNIERESDIHRWPNKGCQIQKIYDFGVEGL